MTNKWEGAAESAGEWGGVSLLIDTNGNVGNFKREFCAACTGVADGTSGDAERLAVAYDGPDLCELIGIYDPETDRRCDVRAMKKTPRGRLETIRIYMTHEPSARVLAGIKTRAVAFAARGVDGEAPFKILGFRMIRERTVAQTRPV